MNISILAYNANFSDIPLKQDMHVKLIAYMFLHSLGVSNILQPPDDIHSQLSTNAIQLKYDQLTCAICDRLLIRLRFPSQIAKMCT
jgi:hypothetical protein